MPAHPRAAKFFFFVLSSVILSVLTLPSTTLAQSPYDQTGHWTQPSDPGADWDHRPIHMALLPGDSNYHSYILSWHGNSDGTAATWNGGLWGWNPPKPDDGCGNYENSGLVRIPDPQQPVHPGVQIFCSGHSALPTGELFIAGGNQPGWNGTNGIYDGLIFDSRAVDPQGRQGVWTSTDTMAVRRYYPTNTTLSDGTVLVTAGWQYHHALTFGGRSVPGSASSSRDEIQRLAAMKSARWDAAEVNPSGVPWPESRSHHTAVMRPGPGKPPNAELSRMIVFGGYGANGQARDDSYWLKRSTWEDHKEVYEWELILASDPPFRARHAAMFGITGSDSGMYVFGGVDRFDVAQNTVHKLFNDQASGYRWDQVAPQGTPPSARYGHTVVYDNFEDRSRMLVFGGRSNSGFVDADVHILDFQTLTWSQASLIGSEAPTAREGHTTAVDSFVRTKPQPLPGVDEVWGDRCRRAIFYGGRTASGLSDEVWTLWISVTGDSLQWQNITPGDLADPDGRAEHTAVMEPSGSRMFIVGGDTDNPSQSSSEVWALDLTWTGTGSNFDPTWTQQPDANSVALAGQTAVADWIEYQALYPEVFDPTTGNWTQLSEPEAWRRYPFYPSMFLLPSGNVFMTGRLTASYLLKLQGAGAPSWDSKIYWSTFWAPEAVMYRPGKIMKCGIANPTYNTELIDLSASDNGDWAPMPDLNFADRRDHNLTLLPDGRSIATGGFIVENEVITWRQGPQIWDPDGNQGQGSWTPYGDLEPEPETRLHHSAALLLPDGRVLSTDEAVGDDPANPGEITLYCPPYLFTSTGVATKPEISSAPTTVGYGESFTICTPQASSISTVSLLKPSAVTHEFNQDQRYVPLTIQNVRGEQLTVTSPADGNLAPPGYYLLFLIDSQGVPSIAEWISITPTPPAGDRHWPDCTTDLTPGKIGRYSVLLNWTATGDDGQAGTATSFDLRRSTSPIDPSNFDTATCVPTPPPGPPGTTQCAEAIGLSQCTTYYFAVKTLDEVGNTSCISNLATATTNCSGPSHICFLGGMFAESGEDGGWVPENSLFWESGSSQTEDLYRIQGAAEPMNGAYGLRLTKLDSGQAELDQLSLGVVDHDDNLLAFAGSDRVYLGTTSAVDKVLNASGDEVTPLVSSSNATSYTGQQGHSLLVDLETSSADKVALVVESAGYVTGVSADSSGILVQKPESDGSWRTIDHIHPRRAFDRYAVDTQGSDKVRLVFLQQHQIRSLEQLSWSDSENPKWLDLTSADHSRLGDVTDAVRSSGGETTTLLSDDVLTLAYGASELQSGQKRDLFLLAKGAYTTLDPSSSTRQPGPGVLVSQAEHEFALGTAQPNPTSGSVRITYSMGRESHVSIRVYDITGRLVRTLASGKGSAGPHELVWDARDDGGRRVGAGVYFYKMVAGDWRSQQKVVFLNR